MDLFGSSTDQEYQSLSNHLLGLCAFQRDQFETFSAWQILALTKAQISPFGAYHQYAPNGMARNGGIRVLKEHGMTASMGQKGNCWDTLQWKTSSTA